MPDSGDESAIQAFKLINTFRYTSTLPEELKNCT